ncbi:MAG TPA: GH25 family lysozyme [Bellilinea sp.]|nr:GH25 family lysozyme [Bellilinea sp.]
MIIDLSRHNGLIDPMKAALKGVTHAALRLTVGNYYVDPLFSENTSRLKSVGIKTTAYHVVTPEYSAQSQMDWFFKQLKVYLDWQPILDCELDRGQKPLTITHVIRDCAIAMEGFITPIIYTRQTWWDRFVLPRSFWKDYRLHAARYSAALSGPWSDGMTKFRDWDEWFLHQYSADGNGLGKEYGVESTSIDLNRVNPKFAHLLELPHTEPPDPTTRSMKVLVNGLNIRNEPRVDSRTDIGDLHMGAQVRVTEDLGEWVKVEGYVWKNSLG